MRRVLAGALLVVLTACSQTTVAPTIADIGLADIELADSGTVDAAIAAAQTPGSDVVVVPAAELRLVLEQLLGYHAVLTAEVLRGNVDGVDVVQASADALADNTRQLQGAIALAYGEVGGVAFSNLWVQHIRSFAAYAAGLAAGDDDVSDTALVELADYEQDFASFCNVATDGRLPTDAVVDLLATHVDGLTDQATSWSDGRYAEAIDDTTAAAAHMDEIALALAVGIADQFPESFPGSVTDSGTDTRSAVARSVADLVTLRLQFDRASADSFPVGRAPEVGSTNGQTVTGDLETAIRQAHLRATTLIESALIEATPAGPDSQSGDQAWSSGELSTVLEHVADTSVDPGDLARHLDSLSGEQPLLALIAQHDEEWRRGAYDAAYATAGEAVAAAYGLVGP